ncbi:acyltransferase [Paenarthrobacter sp. OM7]|uniref:Acyltransferase family protein n=1 Tax=Paenarthrobacter sp. AMU7 TaxID=3162492 RepID=A0AB39YPS6_9MICC|nr:acyltransferase [Paenarthrobacter sp. OM7]WGM20719.1 acyltransferase [Paenarthrobacter sp. OM7]
MPKASLLPEPTGTLPVTARRLDALTGLRFYAALLVFAFHISLSRFYLGDSGLVEPLQFILKNGGWFGVTFFFILSGFVLMWSARAGDTPGRFIWRRIAKIVPNHAVTFFIALAIGGLGASTIGEAVANLLLVHAWIPADTAFFSINHPSWSLSAELFFYLAFPFVLPLVNRIPRHRLLLIGAALIGLITLAPLAAGLLPAGELFGPNHAQSPLFGASIPQIWAVYALPPVRLLEFALGMLAARAVRERNLPTIPLGPSLLLAALGYGGSLFLPITWQMDAAYVIPVLLLVIAAAQDTSPPGIFASPAAVRLGELSFAFYMVHDIILTLTRTIVGPATLQPLPAAITILAAFVLSLGCAHLLWRLVEVPSNNALRSRNPFPARPTISREA